MTPRERLVVHEGPLDVEDAARIMVERKVKKLRLVDRRGTLLGLVTAKDIVKHTRRPFATRDAQGRLRVGAAIGAKGDYLERAAELIRADVDVIVIDIAHAHSVVMASAIEQFRKRFGDTELIAGNVGTAEGARFLAERGVDGIKVGVGPGGGCTTRITTSFGVPPRGSARPVVQDMVRHLCSSISYGGANSLAELRAGFWESPERYLIKLSPAARRESYRRP